MANDRLARLERLLAETENFGFNEAPCYYNNEESSAWGNGFQVFRTLVETVLEGEEPNLDFRY